MEDKNSDKYKVSLKLVNKILVNIGKEEIDELTKFVDIDREDIIKDVNMTTLTEMEGEVFQYFDKMKCGYYRKTGSIVLNRLRGMMKAKWGRIISISSVVGVTGNPGQTNYAATKAGVIAFTKSLAKEVGSRGITANVVAPGFIQTDMTHVLSEDQREKLLESIPLGRMGEAVEIANSVGFLASEEARYITGETLHVNGGMLMN